MWRPKNINDLLRPVLVLWAGIGFPIYTIDTNEQFINKHSKTLFFSAIIITINIICTLLLHTEIKKDVYVFMIYFQLVSVYCQNMGLVYNLYMKKHDIALLFNEILSNQLLIFKCSKKRIEILKVHNKFLKYVFINIIGEFAISAHDIAKTEFYSSEFIYLINFYVGRSFNFIFALLMHLIVLILLELHEKSVSKNISLENNFKIYASLHHLSLHVIKTFQRFVLLKIFTDFTVIATSLYYFVYMSIYMYQSSYTYIITLLIWTLIILYFDFVMFYSFEKILEQVRSSKPIKLKSN
jgi:hypothetical protein